MNQQSAEHFEAAEQFLSDAKVLIDSNSFSSSVSRSYYAVFHGAKAVLSELGISRKSHTAVWAAFGKSVTLSGQMNKKYHSGGVRLLSSRMRSDYTPNPKDTIESATTALSFATEFVAACRTFLENRPKGA